MVFIRSRVVNPKIPCTKWHKGKKKLHKAWSPLFIKNFVSPLAFVNFFLLDLKFLCYQHHIRNRILQCLKRSAVFGI